MNLEPCERRDLLDLARASIEAALTHGGLVPFTPALLQPRLTERCSSFVTLRRGAALRGCCGTIDAPRSLAEDVWHNAWASAFNDFRFAPLTAAEWPQLQLHISVLSPPEPIVAVSERALLAALRPGIDGLILELETSRTTFLPTVWEELREPADFVRQLKLKAGWAGDFWSARIRAYRYTTQSFGED